MKRFEGFDDLGAGFWAEVRFVSEQLGYSDRGRKGSESRIKSHSEDEIGGLFGQHGIALDDGRAALLAAYSQERKEICDEYLRLQLMDLDEARRVYEVARSIVPDDVAGKLTCMNKQKGDKAGPAYFTCTINYLTAYTLHELGFGYENFDRDPRSLLRFVGAGGKLDTVSSRRYDGAIPSTVNPTHVWEIKEYYHTTTFGSRIADSVYESRLDGSELNAYSRRTGKRVIHTFMFDDYETWWKRGKSYVCRIVDMLNEGYIDYALAGREVVTQWPFIVWNSLNREEGRHFSYDPETVFGIPAQSVTVSLLEL